MKANSNAPFSVLSSFRGKSVLITGATGFIGKVLLEKLLRNLSGIKYIFILIRYKHGKSINERFEHLKSSPVFQRVLSECPHAFSKVIPIEADINNTKSFGISEVNMEKLKNEVSFVFHLAATLKFTEPLEVAIRTNVIATKTLLIIAGTFNRLEAFIYVSTAFSNVHVKLIREAIYESEFSWQEAVQAVEENNKEKINSLKWEKSFPNTYTFSKHLAEKLIREKSSSMPLVICRPSIVTPTMSEPFSGWVDFRGTLMALHMLCFYGILRSCFGTVDIIFSIVPCDYVANTLIISAAARTHKTNLDLEIYNCSPTWGKRQLHQLTEDCLINVREFCPSEKVILYPVCPFHSYFIFMMHFIVFAKLPALIFDILLWPWRKEFKLSRMCQTVFKNLYDFKFFLTYQIDFNDDECQMLHQKIWENESSMFGFKIDRNEYYRNCGLGIRRHLMKEADTTIPAARQKVKILYLLSLTLEVTVYIMIAFFLVILFKTFFNIKLSSV